MYFQIKKLLIWPNNSDHDPQEIEFALGKLNVITGASRTGKSAIIPIIDYCLNSSDCSIPIDTIRDYAAWYGIIVAVEGEDILLARQVPQGTKASNSFFVQRGEEVEVPRTIVKSNATTEDARNLLNEIASISSLRFSGLEEAPEGHGRLSFRDIIALVFQNQDVVANQNILFYKMHAHVHRQRLRLWFPFILGALNEDTLIAKGQLDLKNKELSRLEREISQIQSNSTQWQTDLLSHLKVAQEYGLISGKVDEESSAKEIKLAAEEIMENVPNFSKSTTSSINQSTEELKKIDLLIEDVSNEIGIQKRRLANIKTLKSTMNDYQGVVKKRIDRLKISDWLEDVAGSASNCVLCGSESHTLAERKLKSLSHSLRVEEEKARRITKAPNSFEREEVAVKQKLNQSLEQLNNLQKRYDHELSKNKSAQEEFQKRKSLFVFIGRLEASLNYYRSISEDGDLRKQQKKLEKDIEKLLDIVDEEAIDKRTVNLCNIIAQRMLEYLKILDVEEKYQAIAPIFDAKELALKVQSSDGDLHFLAEVGSASNWVSFHLALMCALQEFFVSRKQETSVPSFVIFDQPSQVYFPQLARSQQSDDKRKYIDEDAEAVTKMFKALSKSIMRTEGKWQGIVLDHADHEIYGDIDGVYEVAVWRNGKKLIPESWISG